MPDAGDASRPDARRRERANGWSSEERRMNEFLQQQLPARRPDGGRWRHVRRRRRRGISIATGCWLCFTNFSRLMRAGRENREDSRNNPVSCADWLVALGAGWVGFPHAIYQSRPQPVDFSHKVHADKAGAKCEDCHAFRDDGTFAGIPTLDKCAGCHAAPMGTTAAEKNFIDRYVTPEPRAAMGVLRAPAGERLLLAHRARQAGAGSKCEACHGDQGASDTLRPYQEDRISGYSRDIWGRPPRRQAAHGMKMDDCVACHRQQGLEHSCLDCHK